MSDEPRQSQLRSLAGDVLDELCQTRRTESAARLVDDLVKRRRLLRFEGAASLVALTLRELNAAGLVTYRLDEDAATQLDQIRAIRVTDPGFQAAGYRLRLSEVGRAAATGASQDAGRGSMDGAIKHPGDRTDFRVHDSRATGLGPIERMPLKEHVWAYPDHSQLHASQLEEREMDAITRSQPSLTRPPGVGDKQWEIIRKIGDSSPRALIAPLSRRPMTIGEMAAELGITDQGARLKAYAAQARGWIAPVGTRRVGAHGHAVSTTYGLTSATAGSSQEPGIKSRILAVIGANPRIDSPELTDKLREQFDKGYSLHEVQHVLGQLHRRGEITYIEQTGGKQRTYRRIELARQNGKAAIDDAIAVVNVVEGNESLASAARRRAETLGEQVPDDEEATPQAAFESSVATDVSPEWPLLAELRERSSHWAESHANAARYLAAAEALDGLAGEEQIIQALMEKASELGTDPLSPVEREYLAYASQADTGGS